MKKIIIMLAISISTMSAFAGEQKVDPRILESFKTEFASAKEVNWTISENYSKAEFVFNGQHVSAFYNSDGELLGLTRYITSPDLPMNLQVNLKKSYSEFWISDLVEVTKSNSTTYYVTVENADSTIVLKASSDDNWNVYKKVKKI